MDERVRRTDRSVPEHDAGLRGLSLFSVLAGTVAAFGTFAIVAAIVGASLRGSGIDTDFRTNEWTGNGAIASGASALTLLIAYLFGGYVAGRMARRNGLLHGLGVVILSLLAGAATGAVVGLVSDNEELKSDLRSSGVPTTTDQVSGVAVAGVAAALAAIVIGALIGAKLGERWHAKVTRRAAEDLPEPIDADRIQREQTEREEALRRELAQRDEALHREMAERDEAIRRQVDERLRQERQQSSPPPAPAAPVAPASTRTEDQQGAAEQSDQDETRAVPSVPVPRGAVAPPRPSDGSDDESTEDSSSRRTDGPMISDRLGKDDRS